MRRVSAIGLMAVLMIMAGAAAWGAVPQLINYQGVLLDDFGIPVMTPTTITFAIWNDPDAGAELWSETREVDPDINGGFNLVLGETVPIPDAAYDGPDIYLSLQVDGEPEMVPRARLVTVPFSGRVGSVDGASGGTIEGALVINGPPPAARMSNPEQHEVCPAAGLTVNTTTCFRDVVGIGVGQRIQAEAAGGARILGSQGDSPVSPAIGFFSFNGIDDGAGGNGIYRPTANTMAFATGSTEKMRITVSGNIGIGTASPTSVLHVNGPIATGVTTVTGTTALLSTASVVLADNAGGAITITLPPAANSDGRRLTIKKISSTFNGTVTIDGDGDEQIDGSLVYVLALQYDFVELVRGSGEWYVVSR